MNPWQNPICYRLDSDLSGGWLAYVQSPPISLGRNRRRPRGRHLYGLLEVVNQPFNKQALKDSSIHPLKQPHKTFSVP